MRRIRISESLECLSSIVVHITTMTYTSRTRVYEDEFRIVSPLSFQEHMYTLSYYDVDPHQLSTGSNTKYASQLGLVSGTAQSILVLRDLPQLNQIQLQQHMMELDSLKSADVHTMQRAMDELTLKDYEANIRTLTAIIDLDQIMPRHTSSALSHVSWLTRREQN